MARGHQRYVFKAAEQFPADCGRIAVRGGQIEGDQLIAVGETMLGRLADQNSESGCHMLRADGCDMALPFLCCGIAHTLDVPPAGPAQGMRDPLRSVFGIPLLGPGAGSTLELVRGDAVAGSICVAAGRDASSGVVTRAARVSETLPAGRTSSRS